MTPAEHALAETLIDSRSLGLALTDRDGALLLANGTWGAVAGIDRLPVTLAPAVTSLLAQACAGRRSDLELPAPRPGGSAALRLAARPIPGTPWIVWTLRRVSEERVVEVGRMLLDNLLGHWLGAAGLAVALSDAGGRTLAANPLFRRLSLDDANRERGLDTLLVRVAGQPRAVALPDGAPRATRIMQFPVGAIDAPLLLTVVFDGGGDADAAPPDALARLLAHLPIGLGLFDAAGQLLLANDALRATLDLPLGELPALEPLFAPEDRAVIVRAAGQLADDEADDTELRARLAVRPEEAVPVRLLPLRNFGRAVGLLVIPDTREQLRLERQVAQAVRMQTVGQLAGGVAHDFNNVLTAIGGYCDLILQRAAADAEDLADVTQIAQNAARAAAMVRQLLAFSRQQVLQPRRVVAAAVVDGVAPLLGRLLGDAVQLVIAGDDQRLAVRADPGQLEQVIVNLAINGRDAMPRGGTLTIAVGGVGTRDVPRLGHRVMPAGDYVEITVTDTGTGIPAEIIGRIYEPFFTTKEPGRGTGLGLSTVYGIVKQTGGFVFARNNPEGGASFAVYLPVDPGPPETDVAPAAAPDTPPAAPRAERPVVLLVEDETAVRLVAERALTRAGCAVLAARDAEEGIEMFDAVDGAIDLLVSDIAMPGLDGPTLAARLRERRRTLPVLLISGYAESPAQRALARQRLDFLAKPFTISALQAEVARLLARRLT